LQSVEENSLCVHLSILCGESFKLAAKDHVKGMRDPEIFGVRFDERV